MSEIFNVVLNGTPLEFSFYDENTLEAQQKALQADGFRAQAEVARTGAELARDQAADLVDPANIFIDVSLGTAEAAVSTGTTFKLVSSSTGLADVRKRTMGGSDLLYQEATVTALAAEDGTGANIAKYRAPGAVSYLRGVGDKLDENRSALDFIDFNRHADIIEGTSTWDASDRINLGIADVGGRAVDLTACGKLAIGEPIKLVRGTSLNAKGTFDNATGRGTKIFLLNGANCPMLLTPKAVAMLEDGDTITSELNQHNYNALRGLIFDGNAAGQTETTAAMKLGAVQWLGEYIGTEYHLNMIHNTRGCGLSLTGDVDIDKMWVINCYFPEDDYPDDDAANEAYAVRFNPGFTGSQVRGVYTIGSMFVELPRTSLIGDPKATPSIRGKAIDMNRVFSLAALHIHNEAALYGVSLRSNRSVNIVEYSGAWMGGDGAGDWAGVSIADANNARVMVGGGNVYGGATPDDYVPIEPVAKRSGVESQFYPPMPPASADSVFAPYIAAVPSLAALPVMSEAIHSNALNVGGVGVSGAADVRMLNAQDANQGDVNDWTGWRNWLTNERAELVSSKNQPGGLLKAFLRLFSFGNAGDAIGFLAMLILARLPSTSNMPNGAMAMVGDGDSTARPMIRVRSQDWFIKPWATGGVDPIGNVTPAHPCEYYNFNTQVTWKSTGNDITDWTDS